MKSDTCYNSELIVSYVLGAFSENEIAWPFVCFVKRRDSTEALATALSTELSTTVLHVHGGMPDDERQRIADDFVAGKISGVVATSVWATGIDLPNLKSVVRAAGGSAPIGLKQESGRGTRLASDKDDFTIYDVAVSNFDKHLEARYKNYVAGGYDISGFICDDSGTKVAAENATFCDPDLDKILSSSKSGTKRGARAGKSTDCNYSGSANGKKQEQLQQVDMSPVEIFCEQRDELTAWLQWPVLIIFILCAISQCGS